MCCKHINFNRRHFAVQNALLNIMQAANQGCQREVSFPEQMGSNQKPADLLIAAWEDGQEVAVDLTVTHAWQAAERTINATDVTRERWRSFLRRKEREKHAENDDVCKRVGWKCRAMAFGTWGGMGPEGAKLLARMAQRGAGWQDNELRTSLQEELRLSVGVALMREIWVLLDQKNLY